MDKTITNADVIIIGGGIIGVSIAYYLLKKGIKDVLLLEKGLLGEGSTGRCVGGIRTQFSTEIDIRFSRLSMEVFENFKEEFGPDPEFQQCGYLFLASREGQWDILKNTALLMKSMDLDIELLSPDRLKYLYPFLKVEDLEGGSFSKNDGYAGPHEVLQGFVKGARRSGAFLMEGEEVTHINVEKGRVKSVETARGDKIYSPIIINAAGPYAAHVASMVGMDLPVVPVRRQIFFTSPYRSLPDVIPLIVDLEYGWYMRREGRGFLLSGPQDSRPSYNLTTDYEGMEWTAHQSLYRVPEFEGAEIAGGWAGLYEISPDHHGIIGQFPELEGFICANGFSGHGFQHSPAVGILVAELVAGGNTNSIDIRQLRPSRFREDDPIPEYLTALKDQGLGIGNSPSSMNSIE